MSLLVGALVLVVIALVVIGCRATKDRGQRFRTDEGWRR